MADVLHRLMPQTFVYITSVGRIATEVNMDGIYGWVRVGEDLQSLRKEKKRDGAETHSGNNCFSESSSSSSNGEKRDGVDPNYKERCSSPTTSERSQFNHKELEKYLRGKSVDASDPIECSQMAQSMKKRRKNKQGLV